MTRFAEMRLMTGWVMIATTNGVEADAPLRCPVCKGALHIVHSKAKATEFEHTQPHSGCIIDSFFGGVVSLHPRAVR